MHVYTRRVLVYSLIPPPFRFLFVHVFKHCDISSFSLSSLGGNLADELGYCPQADALDQYMSGKETLHFHAKLRGFDSRLTDQLVSEQLKRLHLESLADKAVNTYSGGNKRKLALAVAMLGDPPLVLLVSAAVEFCGLLQHFFS